MAETVDLEYARIRYGPDEILFEQKHPDHGGRNDPIKFRFGSWPVGGEQYLGAITFNLLTGDPDHPTHLEKIIIGGKVGADGGGLVEFFLQKPGTDDDAGMVRVLTFDTQRLTIHVPVDGAVPTPAPSGDPSALLSLGGKYRAQIQDDGNFVVLRIDGEKLIPVWSTKTGPLEG